jgi:hypothetical protein
VTITALPPGSEKPDDGGAYYICNHFEWAAATLKRGDACFFRKKDWTAWRRGTYLSSFMYDGVIAKVYEDDPDDYIPHSLFLDLGDKLVLPEDHATLQQWEQVRQGGSPVLR